MSDTARVVVVTGGAKGIGAAAAEKYFQNGDRVAVLDVDEAGAGVVEDFGDQGLFVACDVSESEQVAEAFATVRDRFGGVDVLVNNAGIQRYSTVTETSEEEWDRVMAVNLKSAFLCAREAIPSMEERGGGVVVNLGSAQSFHTQKNVAPYSTSKTALLGLTRSIAVDYSPEVRCVAVCPGTVDTPMLRWAAEQTDDPDALLGEVADMHLSKRIAQPEEVASLIFYLTSEDASFMTGRAYRIDGGLGVMLAGSA